MDNILSIAKPLSREEFVQKDHLGEFFVWWDDIQSVELEKFSSFLEKANSEYELQKYLEYNPTFLIQFLGGGHGRWVIPQKRLGSEFVPDFIIGDRSSLGYEWIAVELESPKIKAFNKKGDPSKYLSHSIRQIIDWRSWLAKNQNYAASPQTENGLGLTDIQSQLKGLILIGRRSEIDEQTNSRRKQLVLDLNIQIHSYDWLLEKAQGRVEAIKRWKRLTRS